MKALSILTLVLCLLGGCGESGTALKFASLSAGSHHTCGLTADSRAFCWGFGPLGSEEVWRSPAPVPVNASGINPPVNFASIIAGGDHTCGVATDGRAFCWGDDNSGQLGNGDSSDDSLIPVLVDVSEISASVTFATLTAGYDHSCGVATDGRAFCWGSGWFGELGNAGAGLWSEFPVLVDVSEFSPPVSFITLAASGIMGGHTCGLATDGSAFCWGWDEAGQLGNGEGKLSTCAALTRESPCSYVPVKVDMSGIGTQATLTSLTAGPGHTCGVATDGRAFCWGSDYSGQLGNGGSSEDSQVPVLVDVSRINPPVTFTSLTAGLRHTCGLATDGRAFCWGGDSDGQLGNGDGWENSQVPIPVDVNGLNPPVFFKSLTAGYNHTCGVATDGRAFCWGLDDYGQLGNGGSSENSQIPVLVEGSVAH